MKKTYPFIYEILVRILSSIFLSLSSLLLIAQTDDNEKSALRPLISISQNGVNLLPPYDLTSGVQYTFNYNGLASSILTWRSATIGSLQSPGLPKSGNPVNITFTQAGSYTIELWSAIAFRDDDNETNRPFGEYLGNVSFEVLSNNPPFDPESWTESVGKIYYGINNSNKVGIGTSTPTAKLDVNGTLRLRTLSSSNQDRVLVSDTNGNLYYRSASGIGGSSLPTSASEGQVLTYSSGQWIAADAAGGQIDTSQDIEFNGKISIGTSQFLDEYELAVAGSAVFEEVKVKLEANWPDYVFSDEYDLMQLDKLKKYIETHGHLPSVPSAEEVKEDGILLGEMNAKLLEKIEELTLHLLSMNERLKKLEAENQSLKNK